jgi:hypothetical protein
MSQKYMTKPDHPLFLPFFIDTIPKRVDPSHGMAEHLAEGVEGFAGFE